MILEQISWDTDFFKRKTGKISYTTHQGNEDFIPFLIEADSCGYELIYVFANGDTFIDKEVLTQYRGKLVDRKVLYAGNLDSLSLGGCDDEVVEYTDDKLSDDLERLAYLSGGYSRFRTDNGFDNDDYVRLYKTWMLKSLAKDLADKVFVYKENNRILGMVTLKYKGEMGDVGLIAVDNSTQGKGIGKRLINACARDLSAKGIYKLEVVTQEANGAACLFYEKCGFSISSITNIYHFWLSATRAGKLNLI
ncbi:MAG: GNAT family N-acetyltransferase [Prevotellaceae bacterium]|jgi:dTDP-4-amino-4,6-dideoxy-D-galactose acyltransferase|nr:GNAT family N-acetyltransferase [Prevotellaceae bacterium]